jgi:prefoldin alpha subunit
MTNEEELQRYAALMEHYKNQLASIENQFSYLQAAILDYTQAKITIEKINETKKGTEILVPIGGGVFTYASAKETSKLLTDIGAGIIIEKNPEETLKIIDKRIENLQQTQETISKMSQQIQNEINKISEKAQKMLAEKQ